MTDRRCPRCGAKLSPQIELLQACPRCLLELAIDETRAPVEAEEVSGEPPERIGPYRILDRLGEGGMGVVYLAEQSEPVRRRVALKLIKLGMDTRQVIARFEAERQALALMSHANVARVFDAGTTERGRPYFVMEYVPGIPITAYCDLKCLSLRQRLELFAQVCEAIQHAHQKGIIHRDIKPSNVLVSAEGDRPQLKVIDFGVAKATSQKLTERTLFTQQGILIGTPEYMSPEQAGTTALDVDTRTDIYSLGVLLYELLVGALPFDPQTLRRAAAVEMLRIIREEDPPKPTTRFGSLGDTAVEVARRRTTDVRSLARQLRGELEWITMRALEKDPGRRYASASELSADLMRHLSGEPVVAAPPGAAYRIAKTLRRHRGPVAAVLTILVVIVIALVASTTMYLREQAAHGLAQRERAVAQWRSYTANIAAAESHLRALEVLEAKRRLAACEPSLRDWEWRHLALTSDSSRKSIEMGGVARAAFSKDGTRLLIRTADGLELWDSRLTKMLRRFTLNDSPVFEGGRGSILAVSPDGSRVLVKTALPEGIDETTRAEHVFRGEHPLTILDTVTGERVASLEGHHMSVEFAEFSPDGSRILSMTWSNYPEGPMLWDAENGRLLAQLPGLDEGETRGARMYAYANPIDFDAEGRRLAIGQLNHRVSVWSVGPVRRVLVLDGHEHSIQSVRFSPDGRLLATGSSDDTIRVWNLESGRTVAVLKGHRALVNAVAFTPDSGRVVSGSSDGTLRVWDVTSGQLLATALGHDEGLRSVDVSPGGASIVSTSIDGSTKIWDAVRTGSVTTLGVHDPLLSADWSGDGRWIASGHGDKRLRVWNAATGELSWSSEEHEQGVRAVAFAADGKLVASGTEGFDLQFRKDGTAEIVKQGKSVLVWETGTGAVRDRLDGHEKGIPSVAFDPLGRWLASGSLDGTSRLWDLDSAQVFRTWRHDAEVLSVAFSPDGSLLVTGEMGGIVMVRNTADLDRVRRLESGGESVDTLTFSPDGRWIVLASRYQDHLRVIDVHTGEVVGILGGARGPVCFHPGGTRMFTGSSDATVRVWDTRRWEVLVDLRPEGGAIMGIAFDPTGERLLVADFDGAVRIWESVGQGQAAMPRSSVSTLASVKHETE